jgi:hypothetical protein
MLRHWEEYCAGRFPADPVLEEGERFFFETLFVNPLEFSALNGLGNILMFRGELYAAEFFVERAVECAHAAGANYAEAVHDLQLIRRRIPAPPTGGALATLHNASMCGVGTKLREVSEAPLHSRPGRRRR